jgi:uncharacterized protein YbbC (DUF1343 family)
MVMKYRRRFILFFVVLILSMGQGRGQEFKYSTVLPVPDLSFHPAVFFGLDVLEQMDFKPLYGKAIGVLTNQSAVDRQGRHLLDLLKEHPEIEVKILFLPQYGMFVTENERLKILGEGDREATTGARIIDLFSRHVKPPDWAMEDLDLILVDLQDTGVRYSTYITTLTKVMEAASDWSLPVMVLDRPNPLRGDRVDGPVVRIPYQSFEGYHLVPIRHGLTIGEYAILINEMGWVKDLKRVDLTVVPLINWKRSLWFDEMDHPWVQPAPNLLNLETDLAYVGFGLVEGTNLNDGRGTDRPYLRVGAPWLSGQHLAERLLQYKLPGIELRVVQYVPRHRQGEKFIPLYDGELCNGIDIIITDKNKFDPLATATAVIILTSQLYPREFKWAENDRIDKLYGYDQLRLFAAQLKPPNYLPPLWFHDVVRFNDFRKRFLIYP